MDEFIVQVLMYYLSIFSAPYGTTMSRMPAHQMGRQQGFMMDPHAGKLKVRQIHNIHIFHNLESTINSSKSS